MVLGDGTSNINPTLASLTTSGTATASDAVVNGGKATASTLTINNSGADTFAGVLGGTGTNQNLLNLVKSGAGTLTLTGSNSYTGTTSINAGTLAFGVIAANGSAQPLGEGTSAIQLGNATLQYTGGTNATAFNRNLTVTSGDTGTISNTGGGTLTLGATVGSATLTKTAANLVLTGGNFIINDLITSNRVTDTNFNSDMYFSSGGTVVLNAQNTYYGNTFIDTNTTVQNGISNALPTDTVLTLGEATGNTNGKLDLNSFNQTIAGLTTLGTGTANIVTNSAAGTGTNTLTVNNDTTTSNANYTFNGSIQDGATAHTALVKTGDHALILTGNNNTYSGGTTVNGGTLEVNNTGALGYGPRQCSGQQRRRAERQRHHRAECQQRGDDRQWRRAQSGPADPSGTTANGFLTLTEAGGATTPVLTVTTPASSGGVAQLVFDLGTGSNGITSFGSIVDGIALAGSSAYIDLTNDALGEVVFSSDPTKPTLVALDALTPLIYGNYLLFVGGSSTDYQNLTFGAGGIITGGLSLVLPPAYPTSDLFMKDGDIFVHVVPEPSTWAMLLLGLGMLALRCLSSRPPSCLSQQRLRGNSTVVSGEDGVGVSDRACAVISPGLRFQASGVMPKARRNRELKCCEELNPYCNATAVMVIDGCNRLARAASSRSCRW